ncbi:MAG: histidine phosphatase family protein [Chloroflexi bacterium AL-W]|nr:histidine phosphatase family protein [Chloroflexi bacterium AL-N1]NOK67839.1 histidine phosphatase family protein [Chloroflexi bacterium AL-N10]NOK75392.1 histidine phosphatase family protein [Chloroflexi bacterium AL-N5]NOK82180.1 histidine phosphatase family protein [Chloroflexi bacterium AL-W]NOK90025.1 histidine phosphatase family protein [Chloroflexi bacterium AL-N15]
MLKVKIKKDIFEHMLEELYLIRHAAPDRSIKTPYNIHPGPPLTSDGRQEALQTAVWLQDRGIEHLFASPFERTRETADIIVDWLAMPFTYINTLREGAPGETMDQIRARMAGLFAQLDNGLLRRVVLISHGAPIRALLQHTTQDRIDLSTHNYDSGNNTPTSGVWHGIRDVTSWSWELAFHPVRELV